MRGGVYGKKMIRNGKKNLTLKNGISWKVGFENFKRFHW